MPKMVLLIFLLTIIICPFSHAKKLGPRAICEGYVIDSKMIISFNANEKKLICGDEQSPAWEKIPVHQAKFHIGVFLQDRGYYYPKFKEENGTTIIIPGKITRIKKISTTINGKKSKITSKLRKVIGKPLTPAMLSKIERWVFLKQKRKGYPCSKVSSKAFAETGLIEVEVLSGERKKITSVQTDSIEGLYDGVLRRYDAFKIGDVYNELNLDLTERRIKSSGIVQDAYFSTDCDTQEFVLKQRVSEGKARLFNIGFGASTEEYGIIKAGWKHARLGKRGSQLTLSTKLSFREQNLNINPLFYFSNTPSRWAFDPDIFIKREYEKKYEIVSSGIRLSPLITYDNSYLGAKFLFGPLLNLKKTLKGINKGLSHFTFMNASIQILSHDFEYYSNDPRSGFGMVINTNFSHEKAFSSLSAQQLSFNAKGLWNFANLDPPLMVLGLRLGAITTLYNQNAQNAGKLPPDMLYFLGSSQDLRGFSYESIPDGDTGSATAVFASAELRLVKILPLDFQPIAFIDGGAVGDSSANMNKPLFWSPGFGFRWPSLIGTIRLTAAHGFKSFTGKLNNKVGEGWHIFFNLGEEF